MRFNHPAWLAVGLAAGMIILWAWSVGDSRRRRNLERFVSAHLRLQLTRSISIGKRRLQRGLFLAAMMLLCVALAGPLMGYRWEQISRRGNEVVFAIDTSRSMATPDIKPDRLTRAKLAIDDFTQRLDGDAVGIVAFAGRAFLVCPITLDYGAFHESLSAIDTNTIPRGGTNISSAIQEAQAALRRRPGSDRILILVTDGEDLEGTALTAAQAAAADDGLKIYAVGVGTPTGDLIPIPPEQGGGFVKDDTGAFVKSRLDAAALQAMAAATGGFYVPLGTQGEGLTTIFNAALGPLAKHDLASRRQKIYTERYQWPLAASLIALLASLAIGSRRAKARIRPVIAGTTASCGLVILSLAAGHLSHAQTSNTPESDIAGARGASADATSPVVEYNAGTAAYRAGQFAQAQQAFQRAISHAPSSDPKRLADQEDAYYNLGNALYRAGQKTADSAPQDTLQKWTDALKAYETALQMRADDADSKFNRDLVKRKIDALNQKQNPPQSNDQNKKPGQGQGPGPSQPQGSPPSQAQGPGQPQGSPPPKNPDNGGSPPKDADPSKGQQPPQSAQQAPPAPQAPGAPSDTAPQPEGQRGDPDQGASQDARAADDQRQPGQMSREEARELLDSVKGDERHVVRAPLDRRDVDTPDKPIKNW